MIHGGPRRAIASAIALTGFITIAVVPAAAASPMRSTPLMAGTYSRLASGTRVDLHRLPMQAAVAHPRPTAPLIVKNPAAYAAAKARTRAAAAGVKARRGVLTAAQQGTVEEQLTVFPGMDLVQGSNALGADQNTEPPDTQIAVGPNVVVETVNSNMSVWSKSGVRQSIPVDLNSFYTVPAGFGITDARILYDAQSQRFIQTAVAIDGAADSRLYIAVSRSSDASSWTTWNLRNTTRNLIDQPKPGTSDDKVSISWAEAVPPPCQGQSTFFCFSGQFIMVLQKSDLMGGPSFPQIFTTAGDFSRFGIVPAQAQSPTTTQYLVYNNADPYFLVENQCGPPPGYYGLCPTLGEMVLTGTPAAHNIGISEFDPPIRSATIPADAAQAGSATTISTGDDRLVSAVWQNGRLWTSATDGNFCTTINPDPFANTSACLRLIQTATDAPGLPVLQDVTLGTSNDYLYYPAVSMDNAGDLFTVFSRSNAGLYAGVWVTGQPVGSTFSPLASLKAGNGPYDTSACQGHNRWGDYSGAANDPADPTDVWVAGEYALANPNSCVWGTAIGRLTYSAPTVTSVTPATGRAGGGTAVVITGTDFVSAATTVYFGAATASGVTVQSPNRLTATTPPGTGWVRVSASTADGHGANGPVFKYPRREAGPGHLSSQPGATVPATAPPAISQSTSRSRPQPPPPPHTLTDQPSGGTAGALSLAQPLWLTVQQAVLRLYRLLLRP